MRARLRYVTPRSASALSRLMDVDLDGVWWARRAGDGEDGAVLSVPGPLDAPPPGAGWLRTRVPCTALGVLIDAGEVRPSAWLRLRSRGV